MVVISLAVLALLICWVLPAQQKDTGTEVGRIQIAGLTAKTALPAETEAVIPTSHHLIEFLTADRNYWERLALTNAAESKMLQSTEGKTWLANKEFLKAQSIAHTRASAMMNVECLKLGENFVFVRKSLSCEPEQSAALALATGKPTGDK